MKDLIKLTQQTLNDEVVNTVNARELYEFLGIKTSFKDWVSRRIKEYGFEEGKDFCSFLSESSGGRPSKEYHITIDMAKELSMVERNEKGKLARKYFIECEKKLKQVLTTENQLILNTVLATTVEERMLAMGEYRTVIVQPLLEFKEEALPKVSYHDKVLNSPDLVNIYYPISAIKLNKILQEEGVQYKDKKGEWTLYVKYKDKGYASTKTQVIKNGEYEVLKVHLKWTQRGRLLKSRDILPVCEQPC